ncbi:N-acyl amino acid synthase FeeM domain-containing protein [Thermodesulfatator indicus]|uniref:N-acyl amino acid synthase FeeM domain-containing protein n=1 Tax=Thermodesulfatator indicus TaxID=171695 RepID=UPI0002D5A68C|nr:hypothetical protein [Thermodesulfatator indicus]
MLRSREYRAKFASSREDFLKAFSLVYRRYLNYRLIKTNEKELFYTPYQALPDSRVCISYHKLTGQITSTATVVLDSELGLPSDSTYKAELDALRAKGRKLAEITCLAAERDLCYRNGILFVFRLLYRYARLKGATDFVISIHPKHRDFYEKIFLFEPIGEVKYYQNLYNAPAVLEKLDLTTVKERFYKVYGEFPEGKLFADFLIIIDYLDDIPELAKVRNMKARDFWHFFMDYWALFPSFLPHFQKFFSIKFDMIVCEEVA